mgnify:CR=1 FL=1
MRKTIHENGIPFSLKLDIPNEATASAIEEGRKLATNPSAPRYPSIDKLKTALEVFRNDMYIDIINLYYRDGETIERIAEELDVDISTVTRNKKRLCLSLYNALE